MRLASLRLSRCGHFEAREFAFPRADGKPDLHLVIGENEAGKTTLKHALVHFLFGNQQRSPLRFRYDNPSVAADVEIGDTRVALERGPGRRGLAPADAAAPLQALLKDLDGAAFLATQAFSHDDMRENSRLLQESKGDLKDLLMRDAGGLGEAVKLLGALGKEADGLFKRDGRNKTNTFRQAETVYRAALNAEEAARLDASRHRGLITAREEAEASLEDLRRRLAEAREDAARLERETRAEAIAGRIEALERRLAELPGVRLAPGAAQRVNAAALAEAKARAALDAARERRADLQDRLSALPHDEAALAAATEIDDVTTRLAELGHRARDRTDRLEAAEEAEAAALSGARATGLRADDPEALAAALPAAVDRREARRHLDRRPELVQAVGFARKALEEAATEPPPEVPEGPGEALVAALQVVGDLGRYREAWREATAAVGEAAEALRLAAEAAAGEVDCEAPPPPEEGAEAEAEIRKARQRLEAAEAQVERSEETLRARRNEARRARAGEVPTKADLSAAREAREDLWQAFLAGRPLGEGREDYERRVAEADRIADVRFEKNTAIVKAEAAEDELAAAERDHAELVTAREARREELQALGARWAERLAAAGLSTVPADYRAFHARRKARRDAAHAHARARAALDVLRTRLRAAASACADALGETVDVCALDADALLRTLATLAEAADAEKVRLETAVRDAEAAHRAHADRERDKPRREAALADAEAALEAWQVAWRPLAARCGVAEDTDAGRLADVLDGYEDIEKALGRWSESRRLAAATDRFEAALGRDVARLADRLDEPAGTDPRIAGRALGDRLAAARRAAEEAERLEDELGTASGEEARCEEALADARRTMAADREAAGLPGDATAAELAKAATDSDARHDLEEKLADERERLAAERFSWPAARETLAAMTVAERAAALEGRKETVATLEEDVHTAAGEATRARIELEKAEAASRDGGAARARFEAGVHARAMAEAAAEAIRRKLEIAVLSAARDAFEAENRSPVLDRASHIFAAFTGGAYDRLERGWASGQSFVRAHRVDGDIHVDVDGLSDGTRDQLVAAVRLAAAEESPLPFIADDLFVNADDARAANGFRILAGLAHGRQVIYLTHHAHLEAVASEALGGDLAVLRL